MRRLFPDTELGVDPADVYRRLPQPPGPHRPAGRLNMIEGAAAVHGRTAELGGADHHAVSAILRSVADVLLVGAGALRTEGYGPAVMDTATARRAAFDLLATTLLARGGGGRGRPVFWAGERPGGGRPHRRRTPAGAEAVTEAGEIAAPIGSADVARPDQEVAGVLGAGLLRIGVDVMDATSCPSSVLTTVLGPG